MPPKGSPFGPELARLPVDPAVREALDLLAGQLKCSVADLRRKIIYQALDDHLGVSWRRKVKRL